MSVFNHDDTIVIDSEDSIGQWVDVWARRVIMPAFEIVNTPTIRIADIKQRRFNLISREVHQARQEIMAQEDAAIFEALDSIGIKDE